MVCLPPAHAPLPVLTPHSSLSAIASDPAVDAPNSALYTGLCVYEVDDPSRKTSSGEAQDERDRLQKRVAELESVIRELKNKPHPRWVAGASAASSAGESSARPSLSAISTDAIRASPPLPSAPKSSPTSTANCSPSHSNRNSVLLSSTVSPYPSSHNSPFMGASTSHLPPSPSLADSSPLDTPSPLSLSSAVEPQHLSGGSCLQSDYDLSSMFTTCSTDKLAGEDPLFNEIWDRLIRENGCSTSRAGEHCGCLHDPANYNVVLELSLRLRKAADLLGRVPKHSPGAAPCAISQNIAELDRLASNTLGNMSAPPEPFAPFPMRERANTVPSCAALQYAGFGGARAAVPAPAPAQTLAPLQPWEYKSPPSYPSPPWDDSFMSWVPQRQ
ncbi:uncharacterized protein FIBRA_05718 [Fibroporia radiculosa]|uniref:Uncharacterized protein n=1 Tax=Fibroporia radiculosa TaxID=599839 RepID=J4IAV7_9APHY|nr:uncharacterized protein FIBRA_05718 [Fibroporia radiculosa]CCM03581.1 predicted protein [Fibroporia radiculosa]